MEREPIPEQLNLNFEDRDAWIRARAEALQKQHGWMKTYAIDSAWQEWKAKQWNERPDKQEKSN